MHRSTKKPLKRVQELCKAAGQRLTLKMQMSWKFQKWRQLPTKVEWVVLLRSTVAATNLVGKTWLQTWHLNGQNILLRGLGKPCHHFRSPHGGLETRMNVAEPVVYKLRKCSATSCIIVVACFRLSLIWKRSF